MYKKIVSLVLALAMVCALSANVMAASIKVVIDGTEVKSTVEPVADGSAVLVPLKVLEDAFGAETSVNSSKKEITVKTAGYNLVFTLDSKDFTSNGAKKTASAAAKKSGSTYMVSINAVAEAIGGSASYDSKASKVTVDYFKKVRGTVKVSGSTTVQPIMQSAADALLKGNKNLSVTVAGGGSGAGIKDTIAGANNVGMSSRALTGDEAAKLNSFVVAGDGIAIIVNPKNPVKELTKEQAQKIFLGEIKNWKDVGGNNAPILVQTRETGSGTLATLEEMLLEKQNVVKTATPFTSSALIKQAVAKSENAIGFDSIGFIDDSVKAVSLEGKEATSANVKSGAYPLSRNLLVFTNGKPQGASAVLIDYLRSKLCQDNIVTKEGYVPFR